MSETVQGSVFISACDDYELAYLAALGLFQFVLKREGGRERAKGVRRGRKKESEKKRGKDENIWRSEGRRGGRENKFWLKQDYQSYLSTSLPLIFLTVAVVPNYKCTLGKNFGLATYCTQTKNYHTCPLHLLDSSNTATDSYICSCQVAASWLTRLRVHLSDVTQQS